MARRFKQVDYEESLDQTVTIRECLPPDHLARFIVGIIALPRRGHAPRINTTSPILTRGL